MPRLPTSEMHTPPSAMLYRRTQLVHLPEGATATQPQPFTYRRTQLVELQEALMPRLPSISIPTPLHAVYR